MLPLLIFSQIHAFGSATLKRRTNDCLASSCPENSPHNKLGAFGTKYELDEPIINGAPVFKCTERETGNQYVCKFPRIRPLINQMPAEITVLQVIKQSNDSEKDLFGHMHEYFALKEVDLSTLPKVLNDSNYIKQNSLKNSKNAVIYVEILDYYDENWMDGFDYLAYENMDLSPDRISKIFRRLVAGVKYLHTLGYSHSDIKRNTYI